MDMLSHPTCGATQTPNEASKDGKKAESFNRLYLLSETHWNTVSTQSLTDRLVQLAAKKQLVELLLK